MFFGEALQAVPFKVIPLLGEMSATQTKGCPFLEEKVADRRSDGRVSFCILHFAFKDLSTASGPPLLSGEALCPYRDVIYRFVSLPALKGKVADRRSDGRVSYFHFSLLTFNFNLRPRVFIVFLLV